MNDRLLFKSSHFHAAIQNKWHVTVYQQDELLDEGGVIERQTLESVKIGENYFLKENCQFVISDEITIVVDDVSRTSIELVAFIEEGVLEQIDRKNRLR